MAKVLVVTLSELKQDVRILRQIDALKEQHDVTVLSPDRVAIPEVESEQIKPDEMRRIAHVGMTVSGLLWATPGVSNLPYRIYRKRLCRSSWELIRAMQDRGFDLVVANDVTSLPLAFQIGSRVLLDAHEYAPEQDGAGLRARISNGYKMWLCREYLQSLTGMITVSEGIADLYAKMFGIARPGVVRNIPVMERNLTPSVSDYDVVDLVHHGISTYRRGLDVIIRAVDEGPPNVRLHLMIVDSIDPETQEALDRMMSPDRVVLHPPVHVNAIPAFINQFDLAIFAFPPDFSNSLYVLPNKLFEAVQARLGIVSAPSPEIAEIINLYGLGVVADGFDPMSLAAALEQLSPESVNAFKEAANTASQFLSWEYESEHLRRIVRECIKDE